MKAQEIVRKLGVTIVRDNFSVPSYDASSNEITMPCNNISTFFRSITGRPTNKQFTFLHELGHAVCDCLELDETDEFEDLFGDASEEYTGNWALFKSMFVSCTKGYVTAYATTHPWEDFAETFAFYMLGRRTSKDRIINRKLKYIDGIISGLSTCKAGRR